MTPDRRVALMVNRTRLQCRFHRTENMFHRPQLLVTQCDFGGRQFLRSAEGSDDLLVDFAVLAVVFDDLQVLIFS